MFAGGGSIPLEANWLKNAVEELIEEAAIEIRME